MSRGTQGTRRSQHAVVYRAVTVYGRSFQIVQLCSWFVTPCDGPYNPTVQARWFGLFRVRSPLLAESLLFSFPLGTEMVHFPRLALFILCIQIIVYRVPPFGNRRVIGFVLLSIAYRSFSRPSSPRSAKAFTIRP